MQLHPLFPRDEASKPSTRCSDVEVTPFENQLHMASLLFGTNTAWFLIGFLSVQTYNYYRRGAGDHPVFRFLVYLMVFITISHSVIEGYLSYHYTVGGWGDPFVSDPDGLFHAFNVVSNLETILIAPPALFVQLFFTWRIWTFCMAVCGRKLKLLVATACLLISLTSFCAFGLAFTFFGLYVSPHDFPLILAATVLTVWSVFTAFADVTITVCMMVIIHHAKSNTLFKETRDKLSRLFRITVQTGLLTAVIATPIGPLYLRDYNQKLYYFLYNIVGKSYVMSLLANLNARDTNHTTVPKSINEGARTAGGGRLSSLVFNTPDGRSQQTMSEADVTMNSSRGGVFPFIRSKFGRSIHNDFTHPTTEVTSGVAPEPQLELAREGSPDATHEKDA